VRPTVTACVLALAAAAGRPTAAAGEIDEAKSAVGKWIATQEIIFKERKAWQQERELLQSRVDLAEKEIAELERQIAESRKVLGEQNAHRAEVAAARTRAEGEGAFLAARLAAYEDAIRGLQKQLPEPVREKVDPLFRRIPEDPAATKVSSAERFQNVLGILNEVQKASGEITLANEVRPLSDGKPSEVKTVYVGLAQAYFISAGGEAGVGRPSPDGWVWEPQPGLARDVNLVIQVLQNKLKPQFVPLPVRIQ
jgi:hypothetical protein